MPPPPPRDPHHEDGRSVPGQGGDSAVKSVRDVIAAVPADCFFWGGQGATTEKGGGVEGGRGAFRRIQFLYTRRSPLEDRMKSWEIMAGGLAENPLFHPNSGPHISPVAVPLRHPESSSEAPAVT